MRDRSGTGDIHRRTHDAPYFKWFRVFLHENSDMSAHAHFALEQVTVSISSPTHTNSVVCASPCAISWQDGGRQLGGGRALNACPPLSALRDSFLTSSLRSRSPVSSSVPGSPHVIRCWISHRLRILCFPKPAEYLERGAARRLTSPGTADGTSRPHATGEGPRAHVNTWESGAYVHVYALLRSAPKEEPSQVPLAWQVITTSYA